MRFPKLISGRFIRRDNHFRATVLVAGREAKAHVRNSGSLRDLFTPGRPVWLAPAAKPGRKTAFDLQLVELESGLFSVDAHLPNRLFATAVHLPP
jgi:sugar fermentation stimulation protein A